MFVRITVSTQAIQTDATMPNGTLLSQMATIVHDVIPEAKISLQDVNNATNNSTNNSANGTSSRRQRRLEEYSVPTTGGSDCSDGAQSLEYRIFVVGEVLNDTLVAQMRTELQARVAEIQTAVGTTDGLCAMTDDDAEYRIVVAPPPPSPRRR